MNIKSEDEVLNITSSVLDYLKNTYFYRNDANSGTLSTYHSGLNFKVGFPSNLAEMVLPTIALEEPVIIPNEVLTFGEWDTKTFSYRLNVFAGGQRTSSIIDEGKNLYQRTQLTTDLKNLLDANQEGSIINYYHFSDIISSGTKYRTDEDIVIDSVTASFLPPTGETEADRYRAIIDFNASIIFSQD